MTSDSLGSRWLALEGAVNARVVVPGVLLRSDNLQDLSPRDVRLLVDDVGVEVVLDLAPRSRSSSRDRDRWRPSQECGSSAARCTHSQGATPTSTSTPSSRGRPSRSAN